MEFDFILVELIKEYNEIVDNFPVVDVLKQWEEKEDDIQELNFPKPRPICRTYILKEILKYIEIHRPIKNSLKSAINGLQEVFDDLPFEEEILNDSKYQSALRIISMLKVLSHLNILENQLKLFFLKGKKFLLECSLFLDEKDREKRKSLPHVTFPNISAMDMKKKTPKFYSPTKKKVSIIDRRINAPKTPPIKTKRSDLVIRAINDVSASPPPRSPYLVTHSLTSPPSPLVVFKRSLKTPMKPSQRRSWCK